MQQRKKVHKHGGMNLVSALLNWNVAMRALDMDEERNEGVQRALIIAKELGDQTLIGESLLALSRNCIRDDLITQATLLNEELLQCSENGSFYYWESLYELGHIYA